MDAMNLLMPGPMAADDSVGPLGQRKSRNLHRFCPVIGVDK